MWQNDYHTLLPTPYSLLPHPNVKLKCVLAYYKLLYLLPWEPKLGRKEDAIAIGETGLKFAGNNHHSYFEEQLGYADANLRH